jgi:hypothetical protein
MRECERGGTWQWQKERRLIASAPLNNEQPQPDDLVLELCREMLHGAGREYQSGTIKKNK